MLASNIVREEKMQFKLKSNNSHRIVYSSVFKTNIFSKKFFFVRDIFLHLVKCYTVRSFH